MDLDNFFSTECEDEEAFLNLIVPQTTEMIPAIVQENVPEVVTIECAPAVIETDIDEQMEREAEEDFASTRKTLKTITAVCEEAVKEANDFATASGHPRSFEVLSQLANSAAQAADKLINIHLIRKKLREDKKQSSSSGGVNVNAQNVVFTGTTKELLDSLKK